MQPQPIAPEEERFAKNAVVMATAVHECITTLFNNGHTEINPAMSGLAISVIGGMDKDYLIKSFIEKSHASCWDEIKQRNEKFFINNASEIFRLPIDQINLFKGIYTATDSKGNSLIPSSTKDQIWALFDAMVKISIKYIHKHRKPYSISSPEGLRHLYGGEFMNDVNLSVHAKTWDIKLEFPPKC